MNKKFLIVTNSIAQQQSIKSELLDQGRNESGIPIRGLDEIVVVGFWTMIGANRYENVMFLEPIPEGPLVQSRECRENKIASLLPGGKVIHMNSSSIKTADIIRDVLRQI